MKVKFPLTQIAYELEQRKGRVRQATVEKTTPISNIGPHYKAVTVRHSLPDEMADTRTAAAILGATTTTLQKGAVALPPSTISEKHLAIYEAFSRIFRLSR